VGHGLSQWRHTGTQTDLWMVCRLVAADSHQFDDEQDLDLHQIEISEPDPRQREKADPEKRNRNTGFLCKKAGSDRIILDPDTTSSKPPHPRKFGSIKLLQHFTSLCAKMCVLA